MPRAEIIAIGSELLLGGRFDTNSVFLTEAMASIGMEVRFKSVVGDQVGDIVQAIETGCRRAEVVVLTGGLGPTVDDCTREAVAKATRARLRQRPEALKSIRARLAQWGRAPNASHFRQARIPEKADMLINPLGSAPGFLMKRNSCVLVALPGVPAEAEQMFAKEAMPRLRRLLARASPSTQIVRHTLHTFGAVESDIQERLRGLFPRAGVDLGLLPSPLGVSVSLTARKGRGSRPRTRKKSSIKEFDRLVEQVRRRLGSLLYGEGGETMESIIGRHLSDRGLTLAVAESCTGGLIGHRITQVPGSSAYLDRGVICYSNQAKRDLLGVPKPLIDRYGAVSAQVSAAMAEGVRVRSGTDVGLSVTGIAGPGGGTKEKPVGLLYIGLDSIAKPKASVTREFRFHGDRAMIKLRASQAALNLLRQYLIDAATLVSR